MARRRHKNLSVDMDSFLDIMFNVAGIMVLIVAFAAIASTTTRQITRVEIGIKQETGKKQINIICCGNRAVYLDRKNTDDMEKYFSVRLEGHSMLLTPKKGLQGWMTFKEISQDKNRFTSLLDKKGAENHGISLLIYQNSFAIAFRLESIGRKREYNFRHVFLEMHEPLEFSRQKAYQG